MGGESTITSLEIRAYMSAYLIHNHSVQFVHCSLILSERVSKPRGIYVFLHVGAEVHCISLP